MNKSVFDTLFLKVLVHKEYNKCIIMKQQMCKINQYELELAQLKMRLCELEDKINVQNQHKLLLESNYDEYMLERPKPSDCEHGDHKAVCPICSNRTICKHNNQKSKCNECYIDSMCEHKCIKVWCKQCGLIEVCQHGKIICFDCNVSPYCKHRKHKLTCKKCLGTSHLCEHNKSFSYCKLCGGSKLCHSIWCHTSGSQKYEGYCMPCFINNPDNLLKPAMRNHKTKEKEVVDCVMQHYPQFTWVADRRVQDGCSRRRPDLLLDMGSHILIVEIDENKHSGYDCSCENKRLMEISQDLQHRPIVFIRFNPDSYKTQDGVLVKSCWKLNKTGVMSIIVNKHCEWNARLETLNQQIQYWIDNPPEKIVEIVELFY